MFTYQAVRFFVAPKLSYERAVHRIGRYLKATNDKGIIFTHNGDKYLECYVDADFAGGWGKSGSGNPKALLTRSRYGLIYTNFPV